MHPSVTVSFTSICPLHAFFEYSVIFFFLSVLLCISVCVMHASVCVCVCVCVCVWVCVGVGVCVCYGQMAVWTLGFKDTAHYHIYLRRKYIWC